MCVCPAGVCTAGRASTVISASLTRAVCMEAAWNRGSASVTQTLAASSATKVSIRMQIHTREVHYKAWSLSWPANFDNNHK